MVAVMAAGFLPANPLRPGDYQQYVSNYAGDYQKYMAGGSDYQKFLGASVDTGLIESIGATHLSGGFKLSLFSLVIITKWLVETTKQFMFLQFLEVIRGLKQMRNDVLLSFVGFVARVLNSVWSQMETVVWKFYSWTLLQSSAWKFDHLSVNQKIENLDHWSCIPMLVPSGSGYQSPEEAAS